MRVPVRGALRAVLARQQDRREDAPPASRAGRQGQAGLEHPPWTAIVPLVALVLAVYCMIDISRHPDTRQLSPQAWLALCAFGNVLGLAAYLRFGRSEHR
ncbi:PLD nuclease N-terminal domain-containing protein [Streptomyces sp. NPDC056188]|uniref:PLD nuclease N-terminal domain-containing protein n=1 Tax=Streptomyces sp. NPDC056188 TaxID=3345740 RepID=UPI0035D765B0